MWMRAVVAVQPQEIRVFLLTKTGRVGVGSALAERCDGTEEQKKPEREQSSPAAQKGWSKVSWLQMRFRNRCTLSIFTGRENVPANGYLSKLLGPPMWPALAGSSRWDWTCDRLRGTCFLACARARAERFRLAEGGEKRGAHTAPPSNFLCTPAIWYV